MNQAARPRDSGLLHMRLPIGAVASILHRVTGLFLIPVVVALLVFLREALASANGYARVVAVVHGLPARVLGPVVVWVVAQHTYAGIRHLVLDAGLVSGRRAMRKSAGAVLVAALATAALAVAVWP